MILDHFPLLDQSNSHYKTPYCPYWADLHNSSTLVVTVGASWTWGNGIPCMFEQHDSNTSIGDHNYRQHHVYGALVAKELQADFLCLAANASSNFWAGAQISRLLDLDWLNNYKRVYLIWTSTDPGKGFNSHEDQDVDYNSKLREIGENDSLDELLAFMNTVAVDTFYNKLISNKKIVFRFGSDWVETIGFERFDANRISPRPWVFSLTETSNIVTPTCHVYHDFSLDRLIKCLPEFDISESKYKSWIIDLAKAALTRDQVLHQEIFNGLFHRDHPTEISHKQWADSILSTL